ncbi:MAG: hypothetical protein IPJ65_23465 [Archangiaceae bacterium]|nr:hypothetical protein [Archangiaceae bacterium]
MSACGTTPGELGPHATALPAYLLGTYQSGTRVEDSVSVDGEEVAVRFETGNRYRYRSGGAWSTIAYPVSVTAQAVTFDDGPLRDERLSLAEVSPNCRIITLGGEPLYRPDAVAGCPMGASAALTADDCGLTGRWHRTTRTGQYPDVLEMALTVEVQADHFFKSSVSSLRCTAGQCRYDEEQPRVGTWSLREGQLVGPDVAGFTHEVKPGCEASAPAPVGEIARLVFERPEPAPVAHEAPAPRAYGRCEAQAQCTGQCSDFGVCTAPCRYDVQCGSPGDGMIAVCRGQKCMASCAAGNPCPGGMVCSDGLCL